MKNMRYLAGAGILAIQSLLASTALAETVNVSFILTNDIDQMTSPGSDGRGGLDKVLAVAAAERAAKGKHALFVHAGDAFGPSLMSRFDQGAHIVELLNLVAPDVFVPGNHEFDFGEEVFRQRVREANFPVLAANMTHPEGLMAGIEATRIIEIDGVKIGFVGGIEQDTAQLSEVGAYQLSPPLAAAESAAQDLREAGVDFVVAVLSTSSHVDREAVQGKAFDLLLSGDDHDLVAFYNGVTAYAESGSQGKYVTIVDIEFDVTESARGHRVTWHPNFRIIDTQGVEPLPAATEIVHRLNDVLAEELDQDLLTLPSGFVTTKALVRTEETAMGNLFADAIRFATGADIALVNSGSIRGERVYEAGHKLTSRDVLTELPFGNPTYVIEVNGATLRNALENSVSQLEDKAGRFLQVSGVAFEYEPSAAPGDRVTAISVKGEPLDEAAIYSVAINNYLYGGGDGFTMFENAPLIVGPVEADTVTNQVISYLQSGQMGGLGVDGRIVAAEQERASQPPNAGFEQMVTGMSVAFTDNSADTDGQITAWEWDFGDGTTSTEQSPVHDYTAGGTYQVALSVTDDSGETAEATARIEVLAAAGETSTVQVRVAHSFDDAEEKEDGGSMYMDSSDLELVNDDHVGGDQIIGMRFEAIDIPRGAEITAASVAFTVDEPSGVETRLDIHGEAIGNAPRFTEEAADVSSRPMTTASVAWAPDPWIGIGKPKVTPDLTAIIQEIVNRNDWVAGNSIALIVSGEGLRTAVSFDGDPARAPALTIDFVVPE